MKIQDKRIDTKQRAFNFIEAIDNEVFIIGRNKYGIALTEWLLRKGKKVGGYIDDYTNESSINNFPVLKTDADYSDKTIINCVVEGRTIDVQKVIQKTNAKTACDYFALQFAFPQELVTIDFLTENDGDNILKDIERYKKIYHLLEDNQSKEEFEALLNFRLNRDISYLANFKFRLKEQYFEEFIKLPKQADFIDGGGFDSSTSIEFLKKYPDAKQIYYFEPNEASMKLSQERLKGLNKNIKFFKRGLWDSATTLYFNDSKGSASHISQTESKITIHTDTIDSLIQSKVDYIKMDIEGAEVPALKGARKTIAMYKPILAICIYHNQSDFVEIPELILSYNPNYSIYVRHYTQGVFETVMYFI